MFLGKAALGDDHRRRAAVEARRIAGGDRAVLAEGGLELGQRVDVVSGRLRFVLGEAHRSLAAGQFDRDDLVRELACRLRGGEALLRARGPAILILARDAVAG